MSRLRRSLTLYELLFVVGGLTGLSAVLMQTVVGANRFGAHVAEFGQAHARARGVRTALEESLRGGWPIPSLALEADPAEATKFRLVEGSGLKGAWKTGDTTLVLRARDGYRVLVLEGSQLRTYRLVAGGTVTVQRSARGIDSGRFSVRRDAQGRPRAVRYRIAFKRPGAAPKAKPAQVEEVVACRLEKAPPPPNVLSTTWPGGRR